MAIPQETIDIIRERASIEDIIRRYVPSLVKKGKNYVGLCPFHKEKTPSFTVSPEKQIFYCFGCNAGGNVFSFVSKIERLNFPESVRHLGDMLGIRVEEHKSTDAGEKEGRQELIRINNLVMAFYHNNLNSGNHKVAMNYLLERGVQPASIKSFKLGYAPDEWHGVTHALMKEKINMGQASRIGVVGVSNKKGKDNYYDRFRDRIIFPIINQKNETIAFGGRILGKGDPKYLNSPESEIFKKSSTLYGFILAKEHIVSLERAIIVEGYLDVIGCYQAGIKNIVAPLGTALTETQVRFLSRYCKEMVLLFDADSAGIKASLRSLDIIKDINVKVKVARLLEDDPFDFIKKKGMRELMAVVDAAVGPVDFKLNCVLEDRNNEPLISTMIKLFRVIKEVEFETERSEYLRKIALHLNVSENDIRRDYAKFINAGNNLQDGSTPEYDDSSRLEQIDFISKLYRDLVIFLCHYPAMVEQALMDFTEQDIIDETAKNIFRKITELFSENKKIDIAKMFDFFPEGDERKLLEKNIFKEYSLENPNSAYTEIYINLKLTSIDKKIKYFADMIEKSVFSNQKDVKDYLTEIEVLRREREKLSTYIYDKNFM